MSNLQMRLITAAFLITISLSMTWAGGTGFRLFILTIGAAIYHEWQILTIKHQTHLSRGIGWLFYILAGALLLFDFPANLIFSAIITGAVALALLGRTNAVWLAGGGLIYALIAPVTLSFIRDAPGGLDMILFLYAVVWSTDSAAYFSGRAFGGAKLAPKISPNKTWSGALGGLIAAMIAGPTVALVMLPDFEWRFVPIMLILAFVLCVVSQIGDIAESWLKRRFHAKDSGSLLPGHGGFMDRTDGLIVASLSFYLILQIFP